VVEAAGVTRRRPGRGESWASALEPGRQARRGALMDVVEDLANDIGVGDVGNDPQPPTVCGQSVMSNSKTRFSR
jgi:hypothetical protein